jgi:uncharacterized protein YbjT (DUF2867 family)
MDHCEEIFRKSGPIWGIFSVQVTDKDEEKQGIAVVDAAVKAGVKHFVYASGDRGGNELSETNPTTVPHIAVKLIVERYLKKKASDSKQGMTWTIIRPVSFMDNLSNDFVGKGFASMWRCMGEKKLQLVSTKDVGYFSALAFKDSEQWQNRAISVAGDELSFQDASKIFHETMGYDMPVTFAVVGTLIKTVSRDIGALFTWLGREGFNADIQECKKIDPDLSDFAKWLKEESGFKGHDRLVNEAVQH